MDQDFLHPGRGRISKDDALGGRNLFSHQPTFAGLYVAGTVVICNFWAVPFEPWNQWLNLGIEPPFIQIPVELQSARSENP
jgi:hypothetical protein